MNKTRFERQWQAALLLRGEIAAAKLPRRELLKLAGVASSALMLGAGPRLAAAALDPSPRTTPFRDRLPVLAKAGNFEVSAAQMAAHGKGKAEHDPRTPEWRRKHQYSNVMPPRRHYIVPVVENNAHHWHTELPPGTIWGAGGTFPGVTFETRYGEPLAVRFTNELPLNPDNSFGSPEVITHLHNSHSATESDGGPWGFYERRVVAEPAGRPWFRDHHYLMARAGFTLPKFAGYYQGRNDYSGGHAGGWGDPAETNGTMFYHSHTPDFTAANTYKGHVGFFLAFDERDTGDERTGLRLPSGQYDLPLLIADRRFDAQGKLFFDVFENDGLLGDKPLVNGVVQPFAEVARRRYRLRLLNVGPSRILQLHLFNATTRRWIDNAFLQISSDGNLLRNPVPRSSIFLSTAERHDVLVDFARVASSGDELVLFNRLEQVDGNKPTGELLAPGIPVMQFRVGSLVADSSADYFSQLGAVLREPPEMDLRTVVARRTWEFGRTNSGWVVNGRTWDPAIRASHAMPRRNTAERWKLENGSGGWVHPIHVHFEECRVLTRNGVLPPVYERGRKDVVHLGTGESAEIFLQFRDFPDPDFNPPNPAFKPEAGRYVLHCHNTVHEDHGMMARFDVVP